MDLHGVAIALMADKNDPMTTSLVVTSIATSEDDPTTPREVEKDSFKIKKFDLENIAAQMKSLGRIVNAIEAAVESQKDTNRPVVLNVGDDSRTSINFKALYFYVFGERFEPPKSDDEITRSVLHLYRDDDWENAKKYWEAGNPRGSETEVRIEAAIDENNQLEALIATFTEARERFFSENPGFRQQFAEVYRKLSGLLKKCTLEINSFSPTPLLAKDLKKYPLDERLIPLKKQLADPDKDISGKAHTKILEIAREEGKLYAGIPKLFSLKYPEGYDDTTKELYPSHFFLDWDVAYQEAFHKGFEEHYTGIGKARLMLPSDPPQKPFVTPCVYGVWTQHAIYKGEHSSDNRVDDPELRDKMAASAARAATALETTTLPSAGGGLGDIRSQSQEPETGIQ